MNPLLSFLTIPEHMPSAHRRYAEIKNRHAEAERLAGFEAAGREGEREV